MLSGRASEKGRFQRATKGTAARSLAHLLQTSKRTKLIRERRGSSVFTIRFLARPLARSPSSGPKSANRSCAHRKCHLRPRLLAGASGARFCRAKIDYISRALFGKLRLARALVCWLGPTSQPASQPARLYLLKRLASASSAVGGALGAAAGNVLILLGPIVCARPSLETNGPAARPATWSGGDLLADEARGLGAAGAKGT